MGEGIAGGGAVGGGASGGAVDEGSLDSVPVQDVRDFLKRLHDGPPQHAAAVKVALAVWQGAVAQGDQDGARAALQMVRDEVNRLVESIAEIQALGRQLTGEDSA